MREPRQAEQRDRQVGTLHEPHERHADHQARPDGKSAASRVEQAHPEVPLQRQADGAARQTSKICSQEGKPSEDRNLFQVEVPDGGQVEGKPECEGPPCRIGQETGEGDAPEVALAENLRNRRTTAVTLEVPLLTGPDVPRVQPPTTRGGDPAIGTTITTAPPSGPNAPVNTNAACQLRVRIAQATSGGASIDPTDAPMLKTPPARPRSVAGNHSDVLSCRRGSPNPRQGRAGREPEERLPPVRQPVRHADEGPRDGEQRESDFQPDTRRADSHRTAEA